MHVYLWTMKPTGGAITVDGKNERGEGVKLRHIKTVHFEKLIETTPPRWWQRKPRRTLRSVHLVATDKDGNTHTLHIIG